MATRKIKDAKDLSTNELIYFKGHAKATYLSDGRNVEEALDTLETPNIYHWKTYDGTPEGTVDTETYIGIVKADILIIDFGTTGTLVSSNKSNVLYGTNGTRFSFLTGDSYIGELVIYTDGSYIVRGFEIANKDELSGKQDKISDLDVIREGAGLGTTALQFVPAEYVTETELTNKGYATTSALNEKVDKVTGKQLTTEDFTTALKTKLEGLNNYDDEEIQNALASLQTQFNTLVSGNASDAINSFNEIIAFLNGIEDSENLDSIIASIEQQIAGKMDKVTLAAVATSGSYNDLSNKPTIPSTVTESTVSGWGFTKNTGTYSKPSGGIPASDLAPDVFLQGEKGEQGPKGDDGVGIASVVQTTTSAADGGSNVMTVTLSNGTKSTFTVNNGSKGIQGPKGDQGDKGDKGDTGADGTDGEDGATFTPTVDANGNLSWTNNKGLSNPPTVNIKGPKGDSGEGGGESGGESSSGGIKSVLLDRKQSSFILQPNTFSILYADGLSATTYNFDFNLPTNEEVRNGLIVEYKLRIALGAYKPSLGGVYILPSISFPYPRVVYSDDINFTQGVYDMSFIPIATSNAGVKMLCSWTKFNVDYTGGDLDMSGPT